MTLQYFLLDVRYLYCTYLLRRSSGLPCGLCHCHFGSKWLNIWTTWPIKSINENALSQQLQYIWNSAHLLLDYIKGLGWLGQLSKTWQPWQRLKMFFFSLDGKSAWVEERENGVLSTDPHHPLFLNLSSRKSLKVDPEVPTLAVGAVSGERRLLLEEPKSTRGTQRPWGPMP